MPPINKNSIHSWNYRTTEISEDGGSLTLGFEDLDGQEQILVFVQHTNLKYYQGLKDKLPGRIYINDFLIGKRSQQEATILQYLEENLLKDESFSEASLLLQKIAFIKSDPFLTNTPINQELSEVRRKYIESIDNDHTYKLNPLEEKYVKLKNDEITIVDFEEWVYENEIVIEEYYSQSVYDNLIILDYASRESKAELVKALSIDFRKLELISLYNTISQILKSTCEIDDLVCQDSSDYFNYDFAFKIEGVAVSILNPFRLINANIDIDSKERVTEFRDRFKNPRYFFELLKSELNTENIRLVIQEEISEMHYDHHSEAYSGTQEEIYITVGKHRLIINREFVKTKMIKYWQ